jgi:selenide,water dikinase
LFDSSDYPDLLVGLDDPDDAAVWRLDSERALVVTTDFFTPVVDDPFDFGQIAAANALSDIYAMGGQPFLALNIAAFPPDLPAEILAEILRGGAEKARQAGVVVAGGHTIRDREPKYGLVVVGFVHPDKKLTKTGLRPRDILVLTKPLGFGVTTTALKQEKATQADVQEVMDWMKRLNKEAASLAREFNLQAGTDITGFGLLGHALEMAEASNLRLQFSVKDIPFVSCAHKYSNMWTFPGGASDNRNYYGSRVNFAPGLSEEMQMLLFDPQTSGGLLLGVPASSLPEFKRRAGQVDQPVWVVGQVMDGQGIEVI